MTSTEVAINEQPSVAKFITRLQPEIARALPKHMDADRVARLALTVVRQSEIEARKAGKPQNSLTNCTLDSFAGALLTAAALGLEPGINGETYLVPYKGECTLIVGYQGYVKLFYQHPLAKHLDAHAVHERDEFDYAYGLAQYLRHKPAPGERGKVTGYYAVAELSTGASAFVVLSVDEVKALRGGKVGPSGNIPDPQRWMERKTAIRQLIKLLPKSTHLAAGLAVDERSGRELAAHDAAAVIDRGDALPTMQPAEPVDGPPAARVTAAEITAPRPPRPITAGQSRRMHALYRELGIEGRDERLADTSEVVHRDITSSADLSSDEAKLLIDYLELRVTPAADGAE